MDLKGFILGSNGGSEDSKGVQEGSEGFKWGQMESRGFIWVRGVRPFQAL